MIELRRLQPVCPPDQIMLNHMKQFVLCLFSPVVVKSVDVWSCLHLALWYFWNVFTNLHLLLWDSQKKGEVKSEEAVVAD